ncbi:uncharacterized protein LOC142795369 [Rhipicephalus microplus]|uniref:uncharacterized protein LOC142795369 n=1 Tax=Rhipicephalus microplus TaxID=6941 RepID=UPI003F6C24EF
MYAMDYMTSAVGTKSVKTVGYATYVAHASGRETALLLDDDDADWESRFSMDTLKRECIGKSEGGGKKIDRSSRTREGKGRSPKASYKRRAVSKEGLSEKIKDSVSSSSFMTPRGEANPPLEDDAPVSRQRGGPKLASTAHGKNRSSKTHGTPTWKSSKGSDIIRQGSVDDAKNRDKANTAQKQTSNDEEAAEHTRALRFRPHGQEGKGQETKILLETRSFSKATTPAASSPQHVLFSHVVYPAPSIPTSCGHAAETGSALANCFLHERIPHSHSVEHEQMVCQERRAARDSQSTHKDSNASQWSTTAMIGTSECGSNYVVNETDPSKRHCESHKKPAFSDKVFGAAEIKDFVFDFSGHMPGVQRCQSRRRKDVLRSKRRLLRRKRKSIDLPKASAHCEGPLHDSVRTEEETRCSPLDKAWVDRVDETQRYNPLLATDVSFRLRHSWSKRGLLWHVTRFCAERGDSLRNLFTRQQQVAVAETALLYKSGPKAASKHTEGTSSGENNEKSNDAESEEGCEEKHDSPRKAQAGGARGDYENDQTRGRRETRDRSRAEAAAGAGGPHDHVLHADEHGGGAPQQQNFWSEYRAGESGYPRSNVTYDVKASPKSE